MTMKSLAENKFFNVCYIYKQSFKATAVYPTFCEYYRACSALIIVVIILVYFISILCYRARVCVLI